MLKVGADAPDFDLPGIDARGRFHDLLGDGVVVLYFYPRDFTPVCTREACMFRDYHADLIAEGVRVIGVSPQPESRQAEFRERYKLPFPLLADPEKKVIRSYDADGPFGIGVRRVSYLVGRDAKIHDVAEADFRLDPHERFVKRVLEASRSDRP